MNEKDRRGNGKLRVSNIEILNKNNIEVAELISGEEYSIIFNYTKNSEINPDHFTIVVQLKNENDEIITTIATDEQGTSFNKIPSTGQICIHIPKLQLRQGRYLLNYMISEKPSFNTPHQILDYLSDAIILNVDKGDYWGSGILNRPRGFIQESSILLKN